MGAGGRYLKLTRYKAQRIIDSIAEGNYMDTAAALNGISRAALYEWLQIGRNLRAKLEAEVGQAVEVDREIHEAEKESAKAGPRAPIDTLAHIRKAGEKDKFWICVELADGVEKARAIAEAKMVQQVVKHGARNWKAAAWWLERTKPKKWGPRSAVEISGPEGGPVAVSVQAEQVAKMLEGMTDAQLEGAAKLVETIAGVGVATTEPISGAIGAD